jgi:hypothetical protein
MIQILCPTCGAPGRASEDKIDTRLVCRKCMKAFHITPSGRAVMGEPPPTGEAAARALAEMAPPARAQEVDQWFDRISGAFLSPRTVLILVGLVVLAVGSTMYSRGESLEETARRVALAAYHGDTGTLQALSHDNTREDAVRWLDGVKVRLDGLKNSLGQVPPSVQVEVQRKDANGGIADVVARVSSEAELARQGFGLPDPMASMTSGIKSVELPLQFRKAFWSGWRFDAGREGGDAPQVP